MKSNTIICKSIKRNYYYYIENGYSRNRLNNCLGQGRLVISISWICTIIVQLDFEGVNRFCCNHISGKLFEQLTTQLEKKYLQMFNLLSLYNFILCPLVLELAKKLFWAIPENPFRISYVLNKSPRNRWACKDWRFKILSLCS